MAKHKSIITLALLLFLVVIICELTFGMCDVARAESLNTVTATTSSTVTQGSSGSCYVYIDSLTGVSTLNLSVHFDASKVKITSTYNSVSCSLYDNNIRPDYLTYSYVFDGNASEGKTTLFYFYYTILDSAEVGDTYFDIVVSDAYDANLNPINIAGSRTSFVINKRTVNKSCYVYGSSSVTTSVEQEFDLSYRFSTTQIASGSAIITYDQEQFEVVSVTPNSFLSNMVTDINTDMKGAVNISFVGTEYPNDTNFATVKFRTLKNIVGSHNIKFSATDLYDKDLNRISCDGYTSTIKINFDDNYVVDAPKMCLSSVYTKETNKLTLQIMLDAGSKLGAGDFVLSFDTTYLTYISSEKGFLPSHFGVSEKSIQDGILKFSIISTTDIIDCQTVLTVVFDVLNKCLDSDTSISISGNNLYDSSTNNVVKLNFIGTSFVVPGAGHDLQHHNAQAPTCTAVGWDEYDTCGRCDYTTYTEVEPLGHDIQHHNAQAPTCTEKGWNAYDTCSRCDYSTYSAISALGHSIQHYDEKIPTCTEKGWDEYDACSRCDYTTRVEIAPLGHEIYQFEAQAPTCTEKGWKAYEKCVICAEYTTYDEIAPLGHTASDAVIEFRFDPTCTTDGGYEEVVYCAVCNVEILRTNKTTPAIGHAWGEWNIENAPTCTEKGLGKRVCSNDNTHIETREIPSLGHDIQHHAAQEPTCTEVGWNAYDTCSRCDYTTYEEIAPLGHDIQRHEAKAPTCTEEGWNEYDTCSRCGLSTIEYEKIEPLGHDIQHHAAQAPTCAEVGWKTYNTCSRCDYTTYDEIAPLGHTASDAVIEFRFDPTCTTDGGYEEVVYCAVCNVEILRTNKTTPAIGHVWGEWNIENAPTCTENGSEKRVCSNDNTHIETRDISALGHDIQHHNAQAPTCTEIGWNTYDTCSRCDYSTYSAISALGHSIQHYDEKIPTCTEKGWDEYDACSRCDYSTYSALSALGHNIQHHVAKEPTCTEAGWNAYDTCGRCDYSTYFELSALGHDLRRELTQAPTCTDKGYAVEKCVRCSETFGTVEIESRGHIVSNVVVENIIEPTCTTAGGYDEVVYCSVCNAEISREHKVLIAQHTWGEWNTIKVPTCTEKGKEQRVCSSDPTHIDTRDIAVLGHDVQHHEAKKPTCTKKGWKAYNTCSRCEYTTYEEVAPLGHDIHHHYAKEPTCTEEGWDAYDTCGRCDYSTYSAISALGHDIQHHSAQAPTCTEIGWHAYDICDRCDYSTYLEITPLGHNASDWIVDEEPTDASVGHKHKECTVCGEVLIQEDIEILSPKPDIPKFDWLIWSGIAVGGVAVAAIVVVITHKKRKR